MVKNIEQYPEILLLIEKHSLSYCSNIPNHEYSNVLINIVKFDKYK